MKTSKVMRVLGGLLLPAALASQTLAAEGPSLSGFVDFGYNYNFNGQRTSLMRGFDINANSFNLQNAEVVVAGKSDSEVSYRVDVDYGFDGSAVNAFDGFAPTTTQVNLQQALISFPCPLTHGTVTVGKFVTPFGAEVIEAKDNYNYSRGFLFNLAIPLVHTGVKYDKGFMDGKLNASAGVVNGWDVMRDNNKGKSFFAQVAATPMDKVTVTLGGINGPEQAAVAPPAASIEKNGRSLVDAIVKVTPTDKLTLVANYDWGVEEGLTPAGTDTTQNWSGLAAYANYQFSDAYSGALRWETFDDEGSRTTVEQVLNSLTVTLQKKMNDVTTRLEYRQDGSSDKVFVDDKGAADDSQSTVGLELIYAFGG